MRRPERNCCTDLIHCLPTRQARLLGVGPSLLDAVFRARQPDYDPCRSRGGLDGPVRRYSDFRDILSGGNWVTGRAIGIGALVILPLAAPILRPLAKTAIKGGILAYR